MNAGARLLIYDTSNFEDFPLGGQLTSVKGFLRNLAEEHPDVAERTVLIGVTLDGGAVGKLGSVELFGMAFAFLPVCLAERDQSHTRRSLRFEYAKGLLRNLGRLHLTGNDVNYIHTPEAFSFIRLRGGRRRYVFSHGSFVGMSRNLRFFSGSPVAAAFQHYMTHVIKAADGLFVLDRGDSSGIREAERQREARREFDNVSRGGQESFRSKCREAALRRALLGCEGHPRHH